MPTKLKAEIGTLFYVGGDRYVLDVGKNRHIRLNIPSELTSTAAAFASYPVAVDGVVYPSISEQTEMYLEVTNIYRRGD